MDFSFLSQGVQPVQVPNPLDLASRGISLAALGNQMQLQQLELAKQRQYSDAVPEFMARLSRGEDPNQALADLAPKYGLAVQKLLADYKQSQLTQSQINEANAKADQAKADTRNKGVTILGNMASSLATQDGPVTPMQAQMIYVQARHVGTPSEVLATMPSLMNQSELKQWLAGMGASATDPEKQAQIWRTRTLTPTEAAKNTAEAGQANATAELRNVEAQWKPYEAQTGRVSANAASSNAARGWAEAQAPTFMPDTVSGGGNWINRGINPAGNATPSIAQAVDAQGNPVRTGPSLTDQTNAKAVEPRVQAVQSDLQMAQRMRQILPQLKARLQAGDNGPLVTSPQGRALLQTMSEYGLLPQSQIDKVANMSASDALSMELAGPLVHALGSGRGGLGLTQMVVARKPGPGNSLPASLAMIDALDKDMQGVQGYGKAFLDYRQHNPTDVSMVGFNYQAPEPPPVNAPRSPKSTASVGRIVPTSDPRGRFAVTDPTGATHYFPSESAAFEFKQAAGL